MKNEVASYDLWLEIFRIIEEVVQLEAAKALTSEHDFPIVPR